MKEIQIKDPSNGGMLGYHYDPILIWTISYVQVYPCTAVWVHAEIMVACHMLEIMLLNSFICFYDNCYVDHSDWRLPGSFIVSHANTVLCYGNYRPTLPTTTTTGIASVSYSVQ